MHIYTLTSIHTHIHTHMCICNNNNQRKRHQFEQIHRVWEMVMRGAGRRKGRRESDKILFQAKTFLKRLLYIELAFWYRYTGYLVVYFKYIQRNSFFNVYSQTVFDGKHKKYHESIPFWTDVCMWRTLQIGLLESSFIWFSVVKRLGLPCCRPHPLLPTLQVAREISDTDWFSTVWI